MVCEWMWWFREGWLGSRSSRMRIYHHVAHTLYKCPCLFLSNPKRLCFKGVLERGGSMGQAKSTRHSSGETLNTVHLLHHRAGKTTDTAPQESLQEPLAAHQRKNILMFFILHFLYWRCCLHYITTVHTFDFFCAAPLLVRSDVRL